MAVDVDKARAYHQPLGIVDLFCFDTCRKSAMPDRPDLAIPDGDRPLERLCAGSIYDRCVFNDQIQHNIPILILLFCMRYKIRHVRPKIAVRQIVQEFDLHIVALESVGEDAGAVFRL